MEGGGGAVVDGLELGRGGRGRVEDGETLVVEWEGGGGVGDLTRWCWF